MSTITKPPLQLLNRDYYYIVNMTVLHFGLRLN